MAFFIGFVLLAFTIGALAFAIWQGAEENTASCVIGWILTFALLIAFILVPFSLHQVEAGEVAVVKQFGKVVEEKSPGMNFDLWIGKSYEYINTKEQEIPLSTMTYSLDAQVMTLEMTIHFRILGDRATDIVNEYGTEAALISRITSVVTEAPKAVLSARTAMDVIANRGLVTPEVEAAIVAAIGEQYPITITKVAITNIDFSDAFEQAVEEKMIAEQNKLKAEYENEKRVAQAQAEADAKLKEAQAKVEIAKAEAEAKKIEAQAEAEANKLLEQSLTEKVLQDKYLDKWDGKLPTTMLGENAGVMITP